MLGRTRRLSPNIYISVAALVTCNGERYGRILQRHWRLRFIESEESDDDVFFHMEDVGGPDLEEGQEVEFDIEQADKGPRATNVERL